MRSKFNNNLSNNGNKRKECISFLARGEKKYLLHSFLSGGTTRKRKKTLNYTNKYKIEKIYEGGQKSSAKGYNTQQGAGVRNLRPFQ